MQGCDLTDFFKVPAVSFMQVEKVAYGSTMLHLKEKELLRAVEVDSGGLFVI